MILFIVLIIALAAIGSADKQQDCTSLQKNDQPFEEQMQLFHSHDGYRVLVFSGNFNINYKSEEGGYMQPKLRNVLWTEKSPEVYSMVIYFDCVTLHVQLLDYRKTFSMTANFTEPILDKNQRVCSTEWLNYKDFSILPKYYPCKSPEESPYYTDIHINKLTFQE